jgi:hypothetical protein
VIKIVPIGDRISPHTLLAQVAERDGLDAVVVVARVDGAWSVCWSTGMDLGGLSMASMKLTADVTDALHGEPAQMWTGREPA